MGKCNCRSTTNPQGTIEPTVLRMLASVTPDGLNEYKDVAVDACIAPVIQHLWDKGVHTIGSCCGHNRRPPSIVLSESVENYSHIRAFITDKDTRQFELSQWKRVLV